MGFTEVSKGMFYQTLLNLKHKRRLSLLQIKLISLMDLISLIDLSPLVMQEQSKRSLIKLITKTS